MAAKPSVKAGESGTAKEIPPPQAGEEWVRASGLTPIEAAKRADQRLNGLAGVQANVYYEFAIPTGRGLGNLTERIKSPTVFSLEYPRIEGGLPVATLAKADGNLVVEKIGPRIVTTPAGQKSASRSPAAVVQAWHDSPAREVFGWFLDRRASLTELVQSLTKQGYSVDLKQRILKGPQPTTEYMIAARRGSPSFGNGKVEVILNGRLFLPMMFQVIRRKPGEKADSMFRWSAEWLNNQQFEPKDFDANSLKG